MASWKDWIAAARPKTLGAAIAPVLVGSALSWNLTGQFSVVLLAAVLGSAMAIQIATNFFNDGIDSMKGADTDRRLGPRRITAAGAVSARATMVAGVLSLGVAAILSVPLIVERGWIMLAIGVPSMFFAFGYTGGPLPLAYKGLGEVFVMLFFGWVAVIGTIFVQSGEWRVEGVVAGFQIGCLSTVLIAINNLRDMDEDRSTGKRTLAARFGLTFGRWEMVLLTVSAYGAGVFWLLSDNPSVTWWPVAMLPLGLWIVWKVATTRPGRHYNVLLALGGLQLLGFAILMSLAWVTSRRDERPLSLRKDDQTFQWRADHE